MATRKAAAPVEDDGLVDIAEEIFKDEKIDTDWASGGLYVRIARIIESLPDIKPKGTNKFFNYQYITDKQVLGVLRPRLSRARIIIVPETVREYGWETLPTAKGGVSYTTKIEVVWRVVDGIAGESFTGMSLGYGDDSGDKGANKAFTAALKNFLLKLFEIGGDTDDLEADEETDKRAASRESGSRRVSSVKVEDAPEVDVERGGKAVHATETQIQRVGQYARDLKLDPEALGGVILKVVGVSITFGDEPWVNIKNALEGMTGVQIGKLIAALDEILQSVSSDAE